MYMLLLLFLVPLPVAFAWVYYQVSRQPKKAHDWSRELDTMPLPRIFTPRLTLSQCVWISPREVAYRREMMLRALITS